MPFKVGEKPGVYQPVTGQAVVVQTTCVDDTHVDNTKRAYEKDSNNRYKLPKPDLPRRVESHLYAIRKKGRNKYRKGAGTDLKIVTMINGIKGDEIQEWQGVGVVQTPINPDDKTKPQGFRTNATRIGGTVTMINTGPDTIPPNSCIYWDFPTVKDANNGLEYQKIKGHPPGAIYPIIKVYDIKDVAKECAKAADENGIREILAKQERVIGWSLNYSEPGTQLDVILKR